MRDALSIEPPPHIFKKKSLISIGVIMELQNGICVWPATPAVEEEDEAKEEARGDAGNEGAGSSADTYRNMSQERGDGVASIKRRRRDLQSDGVEDFVMASERSRLKEDLESST
ncbi:hypothetical protein Tco_0480928 [Tanacetum coccineum]